MCSDTRRLCSFERVSLSTIQLHKTAPASGPCTYTVTHILFLYSKTAVFFGANVPYHIMHTYVPDAEGGPSSRVSGVRDAWQTTALANFQIGNSGDLLPTLRDLYQACVPRSPELLEIVISHFLPSPRASQAQQPRQPRLSKTAGIFRKARQGFVFPKVSRTRARTHTHTDVGGKLLEKEQRRGRWQWTKGTRTTNWKMLLCAACVCERMC